METLKSPTKTRARIQHMCSYCNMFILKDEIYNNATFKCDGVYTWKSHLKCDEIASKLKMHKHAFDNGYEGVDGCFFDESIKIEYNDIMIGRGLPETKNNKYPCFREQYETVLIHHNI